MQTIKKVMPAHCAHDTEYTNTSCVTDNKDDILQYKFLVPGEGIKSLKDLSSKDMYNIFLLENPFDIKSKYYWAEKFSSVNFDWDLIFQQNLTNCYLPRKCKDFNWKLFHGLVNTEKRLKNMKYSDGLCKLCNAGIIENLEHLFIECKYNARIWSLMEGIIQALIDESYKIDNIAVMIGIWTSQNVQSQVDIKIANVLLGICRYHIWKMRNNIKYGNADDVGFIKSVTILKHDLESHLLVLLLSNSTKEEVKEKVRHVLNISRRFL